jgi:hypothetical protein
MHIFDTVQSYERLAVLCLISRDDANAARLLSAGPATPLGLYHRTCHIVEVTSQMGMAPYASRLRCPSRP